MITYGEYEDKMDRLISKVRFCEKRALGTGRIVTRKSEIFCIAGLQLDNSFMKMLCKVQDFVESIPTNELLDVRYVIPPRNPETNPFGTYRWFEIDCEPAAVDTKPLCWATASYPDP